MIQSPLLQESCSVGNNSVSFSFVGRTGEIDGSSEEGGKVELLLLLKSLNKKLL